MGWLVVCLHVSMMPRRHVGRRVGACRRGVWQMAVRSPARPRTSACWRSSERGCAPLYSWLQRTAPPGTLLARPHKVAVPMMVWHAAGCASLSVLRMHRQRQCASACRCVRKLLC